MKIAVVGGGGREHAIITKLNENPDIQQIFALPGNGGIAADATCIPIEATDIEGIVRFAVEQRLDYVVVAPDDPLVLGAVDALNAAGIACFGPTKAAAELEGSKVFSKGFMKKYGIPTAKYEVFSDLDAAAAFIDTLPVPIVVKADGLARGKGVSICETREDAIQAAESMLRDRVFGESGARVVIEEYLTGPEVSVLAFTDGKVMVPMPSAMDHKRALDYDMGPNTGGMGVVAPNPLYTPELAERCMNEIFLPTMEAMNEEGRKFKGCLFFGLMLTPSGPQVIEYNCRFGDPETQAVLPLLKTDLLTIFRAVTEERLSEMAIEWFDGASACVIVASEGYPGDFEKGEQITIGEIGDAVLFHAGTKAENGRLFTSGGRVIGATATGRDLPCALKKAYRAAEAVRFEGAYFRRDIGKRALKG